MTIFRARFDSKCAGCGERIREGDEATWTSGEVTHVDCPEPSDDFAVAREPCGSCFTVPAANGTCGCDD